MFFLRRSLFSQTPEYKFSRVWDLYIRPSIQIHAATPQNVPHHRLYIKLH